MEKEYQILSYIQQQENATQRDIARETGMGLGTVNLLLKKMIKTGLVKIERLSARSLRYILTPQGFKEKADRTLSYIKRSYDHILNVTRAVEDILRSDDLQKAGIVFLYGPRNEIYEIIILALQKQAGMNHKLIGAGELASITDNDVVLVWNLEEEERLAGRFRIVNVLHKL